MARFGIDIWMTTEAIANGARVCQSFLGAKIHNQKDPAADLSTMLREVVGSLFASMERHTRIWSDIEGSEPVPVFGFPFDVGVGPRQFGEDGGIIPPRPGGSWEYLEIPA